MVIKNLEQYSKDFRIDMTSLYKKGCSVSDLVECFNLSVNEITAILLSSGINNNQLKKEVASFSIKDSFLVISDTHIGSNLENIDYLKLVYEFAMRNNIKNIIHVGDLLQSTMKPVNPKYISILTQINHLLDEYPYDKNICNRILLGNHDLHIIDKDNSLLDILNLRDDFDIIGFESAYFKWNNYLLSMKHPIKNYHITIPNLAPLISFIGHRHSLKINKDVSIYVPTLSDDLKYYGNDSDNSPGFLYVINEEQNVKVIRYTIYHRNNYKISNEGVVLTKKLNKNFFVK